MPDLNFKLSGTIALEYGGPAPKLKLKAYQVKFGGERTLVGEATTNDQGAYELPFPMTGGANIELHGVAADGTEVQLSRTKFGVAVGERLDLIAPARLQPAPAEFTRLLQAMAGQLAEPGDLGRAVERGPRRDISLLAAATAWDGRAVALASTAYEQSETTKIPADALYALYRCGLPTERRSLARINEHYIETALQQAEQAGIIEQAAVGAGTVAFRDFAANERLNFKVPGTPSSTSDFVARAPVSDADKQAFLRVLRESADGDLWKRASQRGVSAKGVETLRLQGKLAYLTTNNAELTSQLQNSLTGGDARQLIDLDYDRPEKWRDELLALAGGDQTRLGHLIPSAFGGGDADKRLDIYAEELARRVRQMDPNHVTMRRLARGDLDGVPTDARARVESFLGNAAQRGFKLGQTAFSAFIEQHGVNALLPGISAADRTVALADVKTLHRLYSLAPTDKALNTLLKAGFTSAHDIVAIPFEDFVGRFEAEIGSTQETRQLYWKAQQQSATIISVFTGATRLNSHVATAGTAPVKALTEPRLRAVKQKLQGRFPTLEALFGDVDYCECAQCRSVLSPAAYLVDILHFIDPRGAQWDVQKSLWKMRTGTEYPNENNPFRVLIKPERRPDIPHIALTCENTNITLPYIDVVNELLELLVVNGKLGTEAFDTGSASSEDLIAEPQNISWQAYVGAPGQKGLVDAVYPQELPFDLPLEMVRGMLNQLGIPLWKLRELLSCPKTLDGASDAPGFRDVWLERIGLGPADVKVLAGEHPWYALYGYTSEAEALEGMVVAPSSTQRDPNTSLRNAKTLSRRLGVTYKELVELLKTGFINPEVDKLVILRKLELDANDLYRYFATDPAEQLPAPEKTAFELRLLALKNRYPSFDPAALQTLWSDSVRERTLVLRSPATGSDFSATTLGLAKPTANDAAVMRMALLKLATFTRLQKKLGWDTALLDRAMQVFVRPSVDALSMDTWADTIRTALTYIAHLVELGGRTGQRVTYEELLTLWAPIGTTGDSSLYARLFLTRSVLAVAPVFDDPLGKYLPDDGVHGSGSEKPLMSDHTDAVAQALQISHDEMEQIFAFAHMDMAVLSVNNLSLLMRYKVLARALDISVAQLLVHLDLTSTSPLQPLITGPLRDLNDDMVYSQTLAFMSEAQLLRDVGLDANALDSALRHRGPLIDDKARDRLVEQVFIALAALPGLAATGSAPSSAPSPQSGAVDPKTRNEFAVIQMLAAQMSVPEPLLTRLLTTILHDAKTGTRLLDSIMAVREARIPDSGMSWSAFVWFPAAGTYKLKTPKDTNGSLAFGIDADVRPVAGVDGAGEEGRCFELVDVRPGQRYRLELKLQAGGNASIEGTNLSSTTLSSLTGAPVDAYEKFANAVALLKQVIGLLSALELGETELDLLLGLPDALDLSLLPIERVASGKAVFKPLRPWLELAAARRRFAAGSAIVDALIATRRSYDVPGQQPVFEAALAERLGALLGRRPELVQATVRALGIATTTIGPSPPFVYEVAELRSASGLQSFADAIAAFVRLGINPEEVVRWATSPIDAGVAISVRGALKGRYAPDAWRRVAQPIFDGLRKKQRNALVAHLTHLPNAPYGETAEQLYGHLLLDSGMEPPVLTSRIQLAISSVQLFVSRCLMNLESEVDPGIIDAKRWEWMRRYRLWEANRKTFLWPENWLEPEFRDDKSHLFRELEAALLQGDVSDELVRTALHTYVRGLEGIARLELMTMFFEPGASADGSTIHLIGRTPHAPHRYFYRKCSHTMWTPWEPLDVEIEGEHLALTMWRGRLHLFWLGIFERAAEKQAPVGSLEAAAKSDAGSDGLKADRFVQLQLNWVERIQDRWSDRSSTSFVDAVNFANCKAADAEARRSFFVHVKVDSRNTTSVSDDILEVHVAYYNAGWKAFHRYRLVSTLAAPILEDQGGVRPSDPGPITTSTPRATKWQGEGPLQATFKYQDKQGGDDAGVSSGTFKILAQGGPYKLLFPTNDIRISLGETTPPDAAGRTVGYTFLPQGAHHVVYRGTDGAIHDLWCTENGWFHTDASSAADADAASGDPHGYPLNDQHLHCIVYCAGPKLVELSWSQLDSLGPDIDADVAAAWRADVLYEAPEGGARPVGRPLGGIFAPNRGVVYRLSNNHLYTVAPASSHPGITPGPQLIPVGGSGAAPGIWENKLLTEKDVPQAFSDPTGFVMVDMGNQDYTAVLSRHVFFCSANGNIHELRSDAAGDSWQHLDLTAATGSPPATGNPCAYPFQGQKTQHVVYRAADGAIHELWRGDAEWQHRVIGQGAPKAASDPCGFVLERRATQHIVYRGEDSHIDELWWDASGWHQQDLTSVTRGSPRALGDPTGHAFEEWATRQIVFRALDTGRDQPPPGLRELFWDGNWQLGWFELARPRLDDIGQLISPFFYEDQSEPHTFFVEPSLAERTVHDWEEYVVTTEQYSEVKTAKPLVPVPFFPHGELHIKPADVNLLDPRSLSNDLLFRDDVLLGLSKGVFGAQGGVGGIAVEPQMHVQARASTARPAPVLVNMMRGAAAQKELNEGATGANRPATARRVRR